MTAEPWVSVEGVAKHLGSRRTPFIRLWKFKLSGVEARETEAFRDTFGKEVSELNAAPIAAEVVALAREMLTGHLLALSGLREECARLIGAGKKVVVS